MKKQTVARTEQSRSIPAWRFPEFKEKWEKKKFDEVFLISSGKNIKQSEDSLEY